MVKNVLVFPCGSEVGLEIHRSVAHSLHFQLIGGSSVEDHGAFEYADYVGGLPHVSDPDFVSTIARIVQERAIDLIFPAHDSVVLRLAEAAEGGLLPCGLVTSPLRTCEISRSKSATYSALAGIVAVPRIYDSSGAPPFPVFLKPDVGQGSKGIHVAGSQDDLSFYIRKDPTLLVLEYLPGKEYTIDCFTDRTGALRYVQGRERLRISSGISVRSARVDDDRFPVLAASINNALEFRGVWFFQVKENALGELVLMEIAPRVAGAMGLSRSYGVNLPLLSLFDAIGLDVTISPNDYDLVMDRALGARYRHNIDYDTVYLDFDDVILREGSINPSIMAFVFQCFNKSIRIRLITRHARDLRETLKAHRLDGLLEDFIWLRDGEEKHLSITEPKAIFIDDSFAERLSVQKALNIPVFDLHMIECLLET